MSNKSNGFLSGLIIGGAAAAAAALLFAPKSGKELRDELAEQANEFASNENNPEFVNQAFTTASNLKDKAVKTSSEALSTLKNQSSELTKKMTKSADFDTMSFEEAMDLMDRELEETASEPVEDIVIDLSEMPSEVTDKVEEVKEDVTTDAQEVMDNIEETVK